MDNYINEQSDPEVVEMLDAVTETSSQEAIKTIDDSRYLGMTPDDYQENKEELSPQLQIQKDTPAEVDPILKEIMSSSAKMTEAVRPEMSGWNNAVKQYKSIRYNLVGKRDLENEIFKMEEKDEDGKLEEGELEYTNSLYDMRDEQVQALELDDMGQVPGQVAGVIGDMAQSIKDNATFIGLNTTAGAALGSITGIGVIPVTASVLSSSVSIAFGMNAYRRVRLSTRGELRRMKGEDGKPLNLPTDTLNNISRGVGMVSGILEAFTGKLLTGGLTKIGSKFVKDTIAQRVIRNTSLKTATTALGHIAKVSSSNAGEEVSSEIASIVGENYALGHKSEEGLANAIMQTIEQIKNDPATRRRLGLTALVGGLAGGGTASVTTVPFLPKIKKNIEERNEYVTKRNAAIGESVMMSLQHQNDVLKFMSTIDESEINQISPEVASEMVGEISSRIKDDSHIFINKDDLNIIEENNPEIATKLKDLDISESTQADSNAPLSILSHQFYKLIPEAPSISEYARLNPEAPNPLEARNVFKRIQDAETQRQEILASLGKNQKLTPEQTVTLEGLNKTIEDGVAAFDGDTYLDSPVMTEYIKSVVPEKQVESFTKAQIEARQNVLDETEFDFQKDEAILQKKLIKEEEIAARKVQLKELNKNLQVLENYKYIKNWPVEGHKKKGYTVYAIDPNSLPADLREAYVTDPKLIKRKVFVEGGIHLEEAAGLNNVENGTELLKILANTPDRKELLKLRKDQAKKIAKAVRTEQFETAPERREAHRNKVFDDDNKIHKKEMDFMKQKKWPETKQGIKIIALDARPIGELQHVARVTIANTKVNEVNVRQYNAGKKTAQRQAINHILKNEAVKAFLSKEKVILNNELTRESLRARTEIANARKVIKRITSTKSLEMFKKAGMENDINSILNVFDLNDKISKRKRTDTEATLKMIRELGEAGDNIVVDDSLSDISQSGSDLTTQQFLRITNRLQTLEKQAKEQNKLFKIQEQQVKANKIMTEEAIVERAALDLQEHPRYDEARLKTIKNKGSKPPLQLLAEDYGLSTAMFTNYKNIVTQLDREKLIGLHHDNLILPMITGENYKRSKNFQLVKHMKEIIGNYGEKEFNFAFNDFTEIEEFKGYADLGDGNMARSDLWLLFSYLGDPEGRERMKNFIHDDEVTTLSHETVLQALEKHLTHKDAQLAQNFTLIAKAFEEDSKQLHFRTTGVMPTMVKGVPITFKGKVYEGGYVPLSYLRTSRTEKANRFLSVLGKKEMSMFGEKGEENKLYSRIRAAEQTEQGRMEDRMGSSMPLDTGFMNLLGAYEETIHDLAYREAGSDTLKLLRNPVYAKSIAATVGEAKYETLVNSVIETVGKVGDEDTLSPFNKDLDFVQKGYRHFEKGFNIAVLGFNWTSVAMQPLSLGAAKLRMGPKGTQYLAKALATSAMNIHKYKETYARAGELNPDILLQQDSVDETVIQATFDFITRTKRTKVLNPQTAAMLNKAHQKFVETSMAGLRNTDLHIKAQVTLAAYAEFMDGNADGFPMSKLDKMTDAEKETKARQYIKQVSDLSLTSSATIDKSSVEKMAKLRILTRFYTDRRAQLNTALSQGRKVENTVRQGIKAIKEGDTKKALMNAATGVKEFSAVVSVFAMMQLYQDLIRSNENPLEELKEVNDMEDFKNFLGNTSKYVFKGSAEALIGSTIVGGDLQYSISSNRRKKTVNLPLTSGLSNIAMSIVAIGDMLEGLELDDRQKKALLFSGSLLGPSMPVNGPAKILNMFEDVDGFDGLGNYINREAYRVSKLINLFTEKYKDDPKQKENIEVLADIQKTVLPAEALDIKNMIPEDALEVMKTNEWDDLNTDTGGAGIYQFTEENWSDIQEQNPDLNLTDNGRVSKDPTEQERAMQYVNEENGKGLMAYELEPTITNLYGAHRFGLDDYVMIALANNDEKLKDVVHDMKLFKGFTSVKQVKDYIRKQLEIDKKT